MKTTTLIAALTLIAQAAWAQVSVTVYNQNLGLVKEMRPVEIQKGAFTFEAQDVAAQIDPTSVHLKLDGASIFEQNFEYDLVSRDRLMERYLDQTVQVFTEQGEMFEGVLLSASGTELILRSGDGRVQVVAPDAVRDIRVGQLPGGLRTRPTLVWSLFGNKPGKQQAELSYLTQGMNWHAEYVAVTAEKADKLELSSWVSIENRSGAGYENAKLKLVAGDVRIMQPQRGYDRPRAQGHEDMMLTAQAAPKFEEKSFFEYHLYTLDQPTTLKDRQTKQLSLFSPTSVTAKREYTYSGGQNVQVNLVFKNKKEEGLGIPLPAGKVRVYQRDDDGALEFVGEDQIQHVPQDEEVRLVIGSAFDLSAERDLTDSKRLNDRLREEAYRIKLRNHKKTEVEITVVEYLGTDWQMLENSHPYNQKNATTIEFKVPVQAGKETVITYRVRRQ